MNLSPAALRVIAALSAVARPLVVGGSVRDWVLGVESKDVDLEVFGAPLEVVLAALESVGRVDAVGASFGVLKIRVDGEDFDVSLPRTEVKTGEGHTGFSVVPDPFISPITASLRRDFTFNALMFDPASGEVLDFHGGVNDLTAGVVRHVSPAFAEDPLRVLRGAQFAARFGAVMAPETIALCRSLLPEFPSLSSERVGVEMRKLLLRGVDIQKGFDVLRETGWDSVVRMPMFPFGVAIEEARLRAAGLSPEQMLGLLVAVLFDGSPAGLGFLQGIVGTNTETRWFERLSAFWQEPSGMSAARAGGLSRRLDPVTLGALGAARGCLFAGPQDGPEALLVTGERVMRITGMAQGKDIGRIIMLAERAQSEGNLRESGADSFIRAML